MNTTEDKINREVVGLIPAAGEAKRIGPLLCSKELYPVGFEVVFGFPDILFECNKAFPILVKKIQSRTGF